jgi:hypothetical protein
LNAWWSDRTFSRIAMRIFKTMNMLICCEYRVWGFRYPIKIVSNFIELWIGWISFITSQNQTEISKNAQDKDARKAMIFSKSWAMDTIFLRYLSFFSAGRVGQQWIE